MDATDVAKHLRDRGQLRTLPSGSEVIPASIMWPRRLEGSRDERRQVLRQALEDVVARMTQAAPEVTVDWGTMSVSGQTVDALLPVHTYDALRADLEQDGVRVDPLIDRQVV